MQTSFTGKNGLRTDVRNYGWSGVAAFVKTQGRARQIPGLRTPVRRYAVGLAVLVLACGSAADVFGVQACLSGRFPDYRDLGCRISPGNFKSLPIPSYAPQNQRTCEPCGGTAGMPRWWVSEPYLNMWVADEPLSYFTGDGQRMSFRWTHRQRDNVGLDEGRLCRERWIAGHYHALTRYGSVLPKANGSLTNAWWHHNWWSDIVVWSTNEPPASNEVDPNWVCTNAYRRYNGSWQATIHLPNGGVLTRDFAHLGGSGEAKLVVLGDGGPQIPITWTGGPLRYPTNGTFTIPATRYGFRLEYPDGSCDVYALAHYFGDAWLAPSTHQYTAQFCLTERRDAQGRGFRLAYERAGVTYRHYRVRQLEDPDGRVSTYYYKGTNDTDWCYLERIEDPYGRSARLQYDLYGTLRFTALVDAAGMTNRFTYEGNSGWITNLATDYGNTSFRNYHQQEAGATDEYMRRAILVTEPNGGRQLFVYRHDNHDVMGATTSPLPSVSGATLDLGGTGTNHLELYYRNTFHWDQRPFANLSNANSPYWTLPHLDLIWAMGDFTPADYRKAHLKHWLLDTNGITVSSCLSSEREPSPDAAGTIEGARTWYDYDGKDGSQPHLEGTSALVRCVARVLPDGTTQYTQTDHTTAGYAEQTRETYTQADGTVGVRTNAYSYGTNGVDLATASLGSERLLGLTYTTNHLVIRATNALNETTQFNYAQDPPQLSSVVWPGGLTATLGYYASNALSLNGSFLGSVTWPSLGRTLNFTYSNSLPWTVSDDLGLSVTHTWDGLNRLTSTTYPDGTYTSNRYDRLDLVGTRDRLGRWTWYGYDTLQHLRSITDARSNVTTLDWCDCGSLASITDALTNSTTFFYNNQGRLTNVLYPDARSVSYHFDSAGRRANIVDDTGRWLRLAYNHQGLLTTASNALGRVVRAVYDERDRVKEVTDADGVTVTNSFDALDRLLARVWQDGLGERYGWSSNGLAAYTNRNGKVTRYTRNAAGWLLSLTNANLAVTRLGYNTRGQVTDLWDGLNQHTGWGYDVYGRATSKVNAQSQQVFGWAYDPNGNLTNRWTPQFGDTAYAYDANGNLTNVTSLNPQPSTLNLSYDPLNRLTGMVDGAGTTSFSYAATGELVTEDGPWTDDTVGYGYSHGHRTWMTLAQPGGQWWQTYGYDNAWRLTNSTSLAGSFGYGYGAPGSGSSLVRTLTLPNATWVTNHYDNLARLDYTALINRWEHVLDAYAYTHDALGLRTNVLRDLGWTTNSVAVGYDAVGQLTVWTAKEADASLRLNEQLRYAYDPAGNLRHRTNNALAQTFGNNALNQLTNVTRTGTLTVSGVTPAPASSVTVNGQAAVRYADFTFARTNLTLTNGNNTFSIVATRTGATATNTLTVNLPQTVTLIHDANGNLTNDGLRSFSYDADNQLTTNWVANAWKIEFVYDGFGRKRIERQYGWAGSAWDKTNETRCIYDGLLAIQERNATNGVLVRRR